MSGSLSKAHAHLSAKGQPSLLFIDKMLEMKILSFWALETEHI